MERLDSPGRHNVVRTLGVAVLAAVLLTGCSTGSAAAGAGSTATVKSGPVAVVPVPAPVTAAARRYQALGRVDGPVEWIQTTVHQAAALIGSGPAAPDAAIYVVQLRGQFRIEGISETAPASGQTIPAYRTFEGTALVWMPTGVPSQGESGARLSADVVDLASIGPVHTFALSAASPTAQ